jgi:hypothetical protein
MTTWRDQAREARPSGTPQYPQLHDALQVPPATVLQRDFAGAAGERLDRSQTRPAAVGPGGVRLSRAGVLALQATAGNRATVQLLQRAAGSTYGNLPRDEPGFGTSGAVLELKPQTSVGNRGMARLLARRAYDPKLAESESVVQAPVMWVKYPPDVLRMTRVELFDAIELIDNWVARGHKTYVAEVKAVREELRALAHRLTTPTEYSTFRKFTKLPTSRLAGTSERALKLVLADRSELSRISLDAIDEVIADRFPGAKWSAAAYLREEDRRAARFEKLLWYQRGSFELHEKKARQLAVPGEELWRELAWLWLDQRDAGQPREVAEKRVFEELSSMYEQLLRQVDAAIQKDCEKRKPRTRWGRIQANIAKAWGDPCKPWFGPDGTHGPDELHHFQRLLRIKRDEDPFACVFYWVEHYVLAYRVLTDPKAQLEEMQRQAAASLFLHWAAIMEFSPEIAQQVRALGNVLGRRAGGFLRHVMLGAQLSLGDVGSIGADAGGLTNRPNITASSPASGARPPVVRGPDMPDLPARGAPAPAVKTPAPAVKTPAPAVKTPAPAVKTPAPAVDAPSGAAPVTKPPPAPATAVKKPPAPPVKTMPPGPPPPFVKARSLGFADPRKDPTAVAKVRQTVIDALKSLKSGVKAFDLPPGWLAIYRALKENAGTTNKRILELLDVVWGGLRNPKLYADIIAKAWEAAYIADTSIEAVLITMAERSTGRATVWIPRNQRDELLKNPAKFFELYASQAASFVDMPLLGDPHGGITHLLQDLVVDRAFADAKLEMTSAQFRALLAKAEGTVEPDPNGLTVSTGGTGKLRTGDYVWQLTYDLYRDEHDHLPQPEAIGDKLKPIFKLQ